LSFVVIFDAEIAAFFASASTWMRLSSFLMPSLRSGEVGTLWSTTASVFSGCADLAAGHAQALEGLRARHLVHEVAVDVEQAGAVVLAVDHVVVENLVVEGGILTRLGYERPSLAPRNDTAC
jgi:hypothetical protein